MATFGSLVYISIADFKDNTPRSDQTTLTDPVITKAIIQAQLQIDAYIDVYVEPYEESQSYKFPTKDEEDASFIPDEIKQACVYIASDILYSNTNVLEDNASNPQSEEWSGDSYRVNYGSKTNEKVESGLLSMPPLAIRLLDDWKISSLPVDF